MACTPLHMPPDPLTPLSPFQQEDLYTTKLDKGKSRISEAEAARLAAEIMSDARSGGVAAANAHIAEERGMEVNDSGVWLSAPLPLLQHVHDHKTLYVLNALTRLPCMAILLRIDNLSMHQCLAVDKTR